jgi:hypothetical protein
MSNKELACLAIGVVVMGVMGWVALSTSPSATSVFTYI